MIKMQIKMNEGKISSESEYTIEQIYGALNRIFDNLGYSCTERDGIREYCGNNNPKDFGRFCRIYNGLKKERWFVDNAILWLLMESDEDYRPGEFETEDLLSHTKNKFYKSA